MHNENVRPYGANNWRALALTFRRNNVGAAVAKAIKTGLLLPAKNHKCVDCGKRASCYDHRDYRKPLDVDPVCKSCDCNRGMGKPYVEEGTVAYERLLAKTKAWYYSDKHKKYRQRCNADMKKFRLTKAERNLLNPAYGLSLILKSYYEIGRGKI